LKRFVLKLFTTFKTFLKSEILKSRSRKRDKSYRNSSTEYVLTGYSRNLFAVCSVSAEEMVNCRDGVLRHPPCLHPWLICDVRILFFFTLVTGPRRSLSLQLSDTRVYEPQIRAHLGTTLRIGCQTCEQEMRDRTMKSLEKYRQSVGVNRVLEDKHRL